VTKLREQVHNLKVQLSNEKQMRMEQRLEEIPSEQRDVILFEQGLETNVVRSVVNSLMEKHDGVCGLFVGDDTEGYQFIIGSKTVECRELATKLREKFDARGGGKSQMIQGSLVAKERDIKAFFKS
jgi:alanyl-tRNA synthetase